MTLELPETFTYEKKGHIALMTINRPEAMNAFTGEMLKGMDAAFDDFNEDPELWVAVMTGSGDKAFCAGMDLKDALPAIAAGDMMGYEDPVKRPFYHIYKPIIAAVNGLCIAGGLEFLQGTDMRIASDKAIFGAWFRRAARTSACHSRFPGPWLWKWCWRATTSQPSAPTRSAW